MLNHLQTSAVRPESNQTFNFLSVYEIFYVFLFVLTPLRPISCRQKLCWSVAAINCPFFAEIIDIADNRQLVHIKTFYNNEGINIHLTSTIDYWILNHLLIIIYHTVNRLRSFLSCCHTVILSSCHIVILSSCHHAMSSFFQQAYGLTTFTLGLTGMLCRQKCAVFCLLSEVGKESKTF